MKIVCCSIIGLLFVSCCAAQETTTVESGAGPIEESRILDHHVHLLSPQLVKHWKSLGVPFTHEDDYYSDVDRFFNDEKIGQMILPSMAYLYASDYFEELDGIDENAKTWMEAENDFVANLAKTHAGKLIGFGSANPTKPGGFEEYKRCHEQLGMNGFKIHVQASAIDGWTKNT